MKAMVLNQLEDLSKTLTPLALATMPDPVPWTGEVLIRVSACGICHTEPDEIEGRTPPLIFPVVPGLRQ